MAESSDSDDTRTSVPLDEDEAKHLNELPQDIAKHLALANAGALLAGSCVTWSKTFEKAEMNSPEFIKGLLTVKSANLVRLCVFGLSAGYYPGGSILLRSAFEALAYLHLFDENSDEIKNWLRLELHPNLPRTERYEEQRKQFDRARDAFVRRAPHKGRERDLVKFLWERTSLDIHSSALALAEGFGLDFRGLLSDEFWVALEKAGDDWGFALDLISWSAVDRSTWKPERVADKEEIEIRLFGRMDADELGLLATMAVFLAHRLADVASEIFGVTDPQLKSDFERWHSEVTSL